MGTELIFWEQIAAKIEILTKAYRHAVSCVKLKISADIIDTTKEENNLEYSLLLRQLNRAIDDFKREMKSSLKDYYSIFRVRVEVNEQIAKRYLQKRLEDLHTEHERLSEQIPEEVVKTKLGHNYFFHNNIKKLTTYVILDYFETNYMLLMEEDLT